MRFDFVNSIVKFNKLGGRNEAGGGGLNEGKIAFLNGRGVVRGSKAVD